MNRVVSLVCGSVLLLSGRTLHASPVLTALGAAPVVKDGDPPIIYTEQATASGTLGGQTFTNALLTLELDGDTGQVTGAPGFFNDTAGLFTVTVAGIGTATLTDIMQVFDNQMSTPPTAGFGDESSCCFGSVLATFDAAFASYDLTTLIGPVSDTSFIRPDLTFNTTLGALNITSAGNSTFTASSPVPEPSSLILVGAGALIICYRLRRRLTTRVKQAA